MIRASRVGDRRTWVLETVNTALVISVDASDVLRQEHWGGRSPGADAGAYLGARWSPRPSQREFLDGELLAYPVYGDPAFKEPCLCVLYADGVRIARLHFVEAREGGAELQPTLELTFEDAAYGLRVTHQFEAVWGHDVVRRGVRLTNVGTEPIRVERVLSAALPLEPGPYDVWTLHGQWGREYQLARRAIGPGKLVVESRRGFTSAEANPWFALARRDEATETEGAVWFGALAWSGSWATVFEMEASGTLNVVTGVQPFDFGWQLGAGEELATPALVTGYTETGLGGASRLLHRFAVDQVLPTGRAGEPRPVLYHSWEATNFAVNVDQQ
ncbi:MAG: alpha-galactosidase, partial [Chloroflexi bacterium]|nr:alpha-galactosidase [Chloroflexota bacterium]